jgi:hypothetical protein
VKAGRKTRVFAAALFLGCLTGAMTLGQQPTFDAVSVNVVKLANHPISGMRADLGQTIPAEFIFAVSECSCC